ncbi:MAG TPA: hypothetical protein VIM27_07855 [Gaiellales bacterium]
MADTATEVRVVAAAEPGSLAAESNGAVRHGLDAGRRPRRQRRRHRGNADPS